MTPEISERAFEEAIERTLLWGGPDAGSREAISGVNDSTFSQATRRTRPTGA